jgi:hypothetical protein
MDAREILGATGDGALLPVATLHARRLLRSQGLPVRDVISVDVDSVLYVSPTGMARTAWLRVDDAGLVIRDEPGFSAETPL